MCAPCLQWERHPGGEFGPSNDTSKFLASLGPTHGLDPDPKARKNRFLTSFQQLTGASYPFPDEMFSVAVSSYVVEHVAHPLEHLREIYRVLRPGGFYVFRTPNLYHYVAAVSAVTPHRFHRLVANRLRRLPPGSTSPIRLSIACIDSCRPTASAAAGFREVCIEMVEKEPCYAVASRAFFVAALAYERTVNRFSVLARYRANIFAVLEKPAP